MEEARIVLKSLERAYSFETPCSKVPKPKFLTSRKLKRPDKALAAGKHYEYRIGKEQPSLCRR